MPSRVAQNFLEHLFHPEWDLPPLRADSEAVAEILRLYETTGGATFSLSFGDQTGEALYVVGLNNDLTRDPSVYDEIEADRNPSAEEERENFVKALRTFIQCHREILSHPRCCIGLWTGPDEDGQPSIYLDISVLVYHEDTAISFGREGNQIAIFALREKRIINIGGTGESTLARLDRLTYQDQPIRLGEFPDEQ